LRRDGFQRNAVSKGLGFDDFFTKKPDNRRQSFGTGQGNAIGRILERCKPRDLRLTKSNEKFREEGIEFVEGYEDIDLHALNELFVQVKFPRREPSRLRMALKNSYSVLWIRYTKPSNRFVKQGQLLGFARVISDGVFYASIWDVAVVPSWQRIGLGRGLMERLLQKLVDDGIPLITLYAERDVVGLYEKLGFKSDQRGMTGMAYALR